MIFNASYTKWVVPFTLSKDAGMGACLHVLVGMLLLGVEMCACNRHVGLILWSLIYIQTYVYPHIYHDKRYENVKLSFLSVELLT